MYVETAVSPKELETAVFTFLWSSYEYDAANYQVKGRATDKVYKLGERVKVEMLRADKELREIDFMPVSKEED